MRRKDIYQMAEAFVHHFIASYDLPPMAIVIDLDHTPTITHGSQQMNLFKCQISGLLLSAFADFLKVSVAS